MNKVQKIKIQVIFGVLLFAVLASYTLYRTKDVLFGVHMYVSGITNGENFKDNFVTLTGIAKNASQLILNNRTIPVDQKGIFKEAMVLLPGYNTITISAKDKFGKATEKSFSVYYRSPESGLSQNSVGENKI